MDCLFQDVITGCSGTTWEHIVQECLGGRVERNDVLCLTCNQHFGEKIDPFLCEYYAPLIDTLRPLMAARLSSMTRNAVSLDGKVPVKRTAGSVVELRKILHIYDESGQFRGLYAPTDVPRAKLERIMAVLAPGKRFRHSQVPVTDLLSSGMTRLEVSFGPMHLRAAAKTILEVLDVVARECRVPPYARMAETADARRFARTETFVPFIHERSSPMFNLENELDHVFADSTNEFSNRVLVCNDPRADRSFGLLQIANTMPLGICLGYSVERNPFSLQYEQGLLKGSSTEWSRSDDLPIDWRAFEWASFSARSQHSVLFAMTKLRQSLEKQHGRALFLVDMSYDANIAETLRIYGVHAITNEAASADALLKKICERALHRRFAQNDVPPELWDRILARQPPAAIDAIALEESLRNRKSLGEQVMLILAYFRGLEKELVATVGFPRMMTIIEQRVV